MDGENAFTRVTPDPSPPYPDVAHLSDIGRQFLAGLLVGLPDIMQLFGPTINSYKRLVEDLCTPTIISWGLEHRAASIRLITPPTANAAATRFGIRVPEKKLEIFVSPLPNDEDMSGASDNSVRLANSLKEAVSSFTRPDSVAREVSGDSFVEHFDGTREHEIRLWEEAVSDWEVRRYFETG